MQVTVQELSPVEKKVAVEIPWPYVAQKLDEAYRDLGRGVVLKGFRKGKVPRPLLEKMYSQQVERDVVQKLVQESFFSAATNHSIEPVAEPVIDHAHLEKGKGFHYSARVEVRTIVEPKDYEGIALQERAPKVTDADVEAALQRKREELTEYRVIEGRAEMNIGATDVALVDVLGKVGDRPVDRQNLMVDLSDEERAYVPGLAAKLLGLPLAPGEHQVSFDVPPAPEGDDVIEARKQLAGQRAELKVIVREVREKQTPALDDEFAKDTGEAETLDALRTKLREKLLADDAEQVKLELRQALVKELLSRNEFVVASALVDRQLEATMQRARMGMAMRGIDVSKVSLDEAKLREELRPQASEEVRAAFLLDAIADKEKVESTEADLEKRLAEIAKLRDKSVPRLRAELQKDGRLDGLRHQLREEKTLDLLLGRANISKDAG
jgi:trigger factor